MTFLWSKFVDCTHIMDGDMTHTYTTSARLAIEYVDEGVIYNYNLAIISGDSV